MGEQAYAPEERKAAILMRTFYVIDYDHVKTIEINGFENSFDPLYGTVQVDYRCSDSPGRMYHVGTDAWTSYDEAYKRLLEIAETNYEKARTRLLGVRKHHQERVLEFAGVENDRV